MKTTVLDIETTGRNPWDSQLLIAGIGSTPWRGVQARRKMHALLAAPGVIVEHTMFDARWALRDGATLGPETDIHDIRTMSWLVDEEPDRGPQPHALEVLADAFLGIQMTKPLRRRGGRIVWLEDDGTTTPIEEVDPARLAEYARHDLEVERDVYDYLRGELERIDLWDYFLEVEVPLARELVLMEARGLPFDERANDELRDAVRAEATQVKDRLIRDIGAPINFRSSQQVADVLFAPKRATVTIKAKPIRMDPRQRDMLAATDDPERTMRSHAFGLPKGFVPTRVGRELIHGEWHVRGQGLRGGDAGFGGSKAKDRTKKARPSTSAVPLVMANPGNDVAARFAYYKELDKLDSSFLSKFPEHAHDGRLYGTVNRTGTLTGRLSSAEPNLQNIPAHGRHGLAVRALFRGRLAIGDYAQLEQRVAAHLSGDPVLLDAYREGKDLYGVVAAMLFGGPPTKENDQRGLMKTGMLAIQYGARENKLAQLILIDRADQVEFRVTSAGHTLNAGQVSPKEEAEAKELLDQLEGALPDYFAWLNDVARRAAFDGYVKTLGGRFRRFDFPEGWHRLPADRDDRFKAAYRKYDKFIAGKGFAMERQAVNAECQGGAADVVGGSMVAIGTEMAEECAIVIQVHDEVVAERLRGWTRGSLARFVRLAEEGHGYDLEVPLKFEAMIAPSWAAKGGTIANAKQLFQQRAELDKRARRSQGMLSRKASDLAVAGRSKG